MIELISKAIAAFNENSFIFVDNKDSPLFKLSLKEIPSEYYIKPSKKNGKPKDDYPPYCNDSILSNTKRNNFSMIFKDDNLILSNTHQKMMKMCLTLDVLFINNFALHIIITKYILYYQCNVVNIKQDL